jgi:hypothetical protein
MSEVIGRPKARQSLHLPRVDDANAGRLEVLRVAGHDMQTVLEGRRRKEPVGGRSSALTARRLALGSRP